MKDLSKLQIQDINGSWEIDFGKTKAIYQFTNGCLTRLVIGTQPKSLNANIHVFGGKTTLIAGDDILDIELLTDKFMITKRDDGKYFLFVKTSEK